MAVLTIRLLGITEIRLDERSLPFRTRKVLALLVYLLVERGMHSRESLMALLWPESPSSKASNTLRVTLSRLRQTLQEAGNVLITEAGMVGFDGRANVELDVDWLEAAVRAETPPEDLRAILSLDPREFLEGFSLSDAPAFDTWVTIQREAYQRQLETIYDRLSQYLLATNDISAAIETCARWVARAPLSEQAYRRLMAAQAMSGNRPAALQIYEQLQAVLQKEFGLEPSRETVVLAENIDLGRLGEQRPRRSSTAGFRFSRELGRRLTLPLVGRSAEHSHLVSAFYQTVQVEAQVVVLIGATGVGKTRLGIAFREWVKLNLPEAEIWQGQTFETGGRLAFQPVVDALRLRLEQVNAPEDLLEDVWLAELSQLMPELRARYPDLPPPMKGDAHFVRTRLFEAMATLGGALAAHQPSVLMLDDIQWADADTLDLIHYLARRWAEMGASVLLLVTLRQEAFAADVALREWLTRLERDTSLTRLLLDNLSGVAVQKLVYSLAGEESDEKANLAFATWLWAETQGLPFFIEALLQMLVEEGTLKATEEDPSAFNFAAALEHVRSVARVPLPPGVREVIRARLTQHSKAAGELLLAAAVLGRACTFERLCQVSDLPEAEALEPLEALLDGRLLAERPLDRRPYTLAHDYIREVVYTESREARRRVYHRRALLALEAASAPAAECAFHALAALLDEPAFRFSEGAGNEAFASFALQEALAHFNTAREVSRRMLGSGERLDPDLLENLYRQRGQVLELLKDDAAAQANYEEMRAEAVQQQNKPMQLSALIYQCYLSGRYSGIFNPPKALESGNEALLLARSLGDRAAEASALWGLAGAQLYSAGDSKQVIVDAQQALSLARELGLKELIGRILNNLCWPLIAQKQLAQALAALREAQGIWRELNNLPRLGEAGRFAVILLYVAGDHGRILVEAPEVSALGASIGSAQDEIDPLLGLITAHTRQGRFGKALNFLEKMDTYVEAVGTSNDRLSHQWLRIMFYSTVGALEDAEHWADLLWSEREAIMPNFTSIYLTDVARTKIACGKLDEGRTILDGFLAELPPDAIWSHNIITIMLGYGELHLASGQSEALFSGLEERVRPYREAGFNYDLADQYLLEGKMYLALSHIDKAQSALLRAKEIAEVQDERAIMWQILAVQSELEHERGDEAAAELLREQARAMVNDIAANAGELRSVFLGQQAVQQLLGQAQRNQVDDHRAVCENLDRSIDR